ncbi:MarR family transcriptional regulator [Flavobacteriaceae bacterium]|jgi:DNA-binding MarR family transcriptional regulator|nr:MarR family transcriptional regulator [Candidatus Neomarinimicrobiota bacterium]MDA9660520.1 MarR family transcriptional regulator [Flavobacteriaceae bacterium]|tara:strand:- start:2917 stop:3354 length:438 start_codon:yes stop_codon:yes gene_type:complete
MKKNTLDAVLRSTWNSVSKMYNREASKFDSTMAMGFALLNIDATGTTSTSLGPRLGMESTSLSRLLNNMEKKNLIIRKQNPSDGRSVLIFLTEFGKNKRDDSRSVVLNFNKHIESKLNKQQVKNFLEVAECIMIESKKFENFIIN